jgi:glycyl-tRNA synthetase alpha subunit
MSRASTTSTTSTSTACEGADKVTYGDVFLQAEQEYSRHNFEHADTRCCSGISRMPRPNAGHFWRPARRHANRPAPMHQLVLPAYDQCIKASHVFNLLDARGVISVTERQSYILRVYNGAVRNLNVAVESFPSNLIASQFKFEKAEYFEIEDEADRAVPDVQF